MSLEEMIDACQESMASDMAGYRYGDPEFISGPILTSSFMVHLCQRIIALEDERR